MIKRILLACLIIFSTVSSALLFGVSSASAADYSLQITDTLQLGGTDSAGTCDLVDMSQQWNALGGDYYYQNAWNYQNGNDAQTMTDFFTEFQQKLDNGDKSGWAVAQLPMWQTTGQPDDYHKMIRIYLFPKDTHFTMNTTYRFDADQPVKYIDYYLNPGGNCRLQYWQPTLQTKWYINFSPAKFFLFASDNITYAEDYTGPEIPAIANSGVVINPASKYVVQNKDLKLYNDLLNDDLPVPYGRTGAANNGASCGIDGQDSRYKAAFLYDCDETTNDLPKFYGTNREVLIKYTIRNEAGDILKEETTDLFSSPEYTFEDYGDYTVQVVFQFKDDGSALPDHLKVDDYNYKFGKVTFALKIDGSNYYSNTHGGTHEFPTECTTVGADTICESPTIDPYEDCSIYGTDLIAGFSCVMRNFGVFLKLLFTSLFVPSSSFLKEYFNDFKTFITQKFGFLVWPLTFAYNFVNAFFDGLSGTHAICGWSFGNLFNRDFKLNFCSLEQNFPSAFNTARYMIQAFTVFVLISGLYNHYRRTIKT